MALLALPGVHEAAEQAIMEGVPGGIGPPYRGMAALTAHKRPPYGASNPGMARFRNCSPGMVRPRNRGDARVKGILARPRQAPCHPRRCAGGRARPGL
jgi:hypothetical protein